ncbi:MAG: hypothetical protein R2713_12280 [Ilumatobacteraceae bacterium]|nr:hypothetical protein [Acidimicrobiales bacterium]MCB9392235.1 hypothetical protein [Acidimicrobiaceae bacterium]
MNDVGPKLWLRKDTKAIKNARGLAASLEALDLSELIDEFRHDGVVAPQRHLVGKTYLTAGHLGVATAKKPSTRLEEHLVLAMFNSSTEGRPLQRPSDGRTLRTVEYQVPLKARQIDKTGKIDALALLDDGRLCVIEAKCPPAGPKESPARALIELAAYVAVMAANGDPFRKEMLSAGWHAVAEAPMVGLIIGPRSWWAAWEQCRQAGRWKPPFRTLCADLGEAMGVTIACAALEDFEPVHVTKGHSGERSVFTVMPTLGDVDDLPPLPLRCQADASG